VYEQRCRNGYSAVTEPVAASRRAAPERWSCRPGRGRSPLRASARRRSSGAHASRRRSRRPGRPTGGVRVRTRASSVPARGRRHHPWIERIVRRAVNEKHRLSGAFPRRASGDRVRAGQSRAWKVLRLPNKALMRTFEDSDGEAERQTPARDEVWGRSCRDADAHHLPFGRELECDEQANADLLPVGCFLD